MNTEEYNPLDYKHLARHVVTELMGRKVQPLAFVPPFRGSGVYALFYTGNASHYRPIVSHDARHPIYVGKAVPPGARKGGRKPEEPNSAKSLFDRLQEHRESITLGKGLKADEFLCRFIVLTPVWITMCERFLIEHYQPVWNVCLEGFGNHDPGKGRHKGKQSWWDVLHPGRPWAAKLEATRTRDEALARLKKFFDTVEIGNDELKVSQVVEDDDETFDESESEG